MTDGNEDPGLKRTLLHRRSASSSGDATLIAKSSQWQIGSSPRRGFFTCLGISAAAILCLFLAGGGYLLYVSNRTPPTLPLVSIDEPRRGDTLIVENPSIVHARAEDPDGVAQAELWVNGQLVASQVNAANENPFTITQVWKPSTAGAYLLFARATDSKGYVGQSLSLLINVSAAPPPAVDAVSQIPASEEGVEPSFAPFTPDSDPLPDEPPDGGDHPVIGVSEPPPVPPDAPAAESPSFFGIEGLCSLAPFLCTPSPTGTPPNAPRVSARYLGACQVEVFWTDESTDEVGFKVYRNSGGGSGDLVSLTDSAGIFTDQPGAGGTFRYYIAAYNAVGESPGAPSDEVVVPAGDCASTLTGLISLDLEALSLTMTESMDRMYCYYSIAGPSYERVPGDPAQFMELDEGGWNIGEYAAGANRIRLTVPADAPLEVTAECFGWRGVELIDLGGFRQSHPPEEWDGRTLSADSDRFTVTYKIQPPLTETIEGAQQAIVDPGIPPPYNLDYTSIVCGPLMGGGDSYGRGCEEGDFHLTWEWQPAPGDTRRLLGFDVYFRLQNMPFGAPAPGGFGRIGDVTPRQKYWTAYEGMTAPSAFSQPCVINTLTPLHELDLDPHHRGDEALYPPDLEALTQGVVVAQDVYYSVKALLVDESGAIVESPFSEEHWVGLSGCPHMLVLQLGTLWFYDGDWCEANRANDSNDDAADLYGWVQVENSKFFWNCPYCDNPGSYAAAGFGGVAPPHDTSLGCGEAAHGIQFWQQALSLEGPDRSVTGFSRSNTTVLIPIGSEFEALSVLFAFYDYDSGPFRDGDDLWCAEDAEIRPDGGWQEAIGGMSYYIESRPGRYETDYDITCAVDITAYYLDFLP